MKPSIYFKGLNGIRAIAALAVLFAHSTISLQSFGLDRFVFGKDSEGNPISTSLAGFGVSIFFSLSGFLITYLLLEEKRIKEINIWHFYVRRTFRIWPLYYVYFILVIIVLLINNIDFDSWTLPYYVFLMSNVPYIIGIELPYVGHYWSLGVEEQFYSFWPLIIKNSKSTLKTIALLCFLLVTLKFGLRVWDIQFNAGGMSWPYIVLHVTRFHCMMIGAIGAVLYFQRNDVFLKLSSNVIVQSSSWLIIILAALNQFHIISFLDNEIIAFITVFIIMGQINGSFKIINLENFLLERIGRISYGIYVIHPLIIYLLSKIVFFDNYSTWNYIILYAMIIGTTIAVAFISFEFMEKKILSMKDRFSIIQSAKKMPK